MTILEYAVGAIGIKEGTPQHHALVDMYNTVRPYPRGYKLEYNDKWCAAFITVCADRAGLKHFPRECGADEMRKKFNNTEYYHTTTPSIGDIIWYTYSHVGIIYNILPTHYVTIEGNANDQVLVQHHPIGASYIKSFGRIAEKVAPEPTPDLELVARKVIAGRYGNQPDRQVRLEAEGYNYAAVQSIVNQMLSVTL